MAAVVSLQVQLSSDNSEACIFKVLPRYKVKSEGDQVLINNNLFGVCIYTL